MDSTKLREILQMHLHWINMDCVGWKGMKADLGGANLSEANLSGANLSGADLRRADLRRADLRRADLSGADLGGANLSEANLIEADLIEADLSEANLSEANLRRAKIDIKLLNRFYPICCPEYGSFIGWKKANGYIVKLQISEDAKRSSAFGRKCRCSKAAVLNISKPDGSDSGLKEITSGYDENFIYRVGETVEVTNFDEDRKNECAPGIHFFITRDEAVNY